MSDPSMLKYARATAAFSSIALRVVTFVFLRWVKLTLAMRRKALILHKLTFAITDTRTCQSSLATYD